MIPSTLLIAFLSLSLATSLLVIRNERRQSRTLRRMLQLSVRREINKEPSEHDHQASQYRDRWGSHRSDP